MPPPSISVHYPAAAKTEQECAERERKEIKKFEFELLDIGSDIARLDYEKARDEKKKAKKNGLKEEELRESLEKAKKKAYEFIKASNKFVEEKEALAKELEDNEAAKVEKEWVERAKKDIRKFEFELLNIKSDIVELDITKNEKAYDDAKAKVDGKKNGELTEEELRELLANGKVQTGELIESLNEHAKTTEALLVEGENKVIEFVEDEIKWLKKDIELVKNDIKGCKKRRDWFTKQLAAYAH